jgi:prepilin-type N-terminal cleavage/methylation domain-containing protein
MRNGTSRRDAFTLVELLVVIGVIAVLIGILLPSLARARQQATGIKCAAQLRGIGQRILMYATHNRGWLYPPMPNGDNRGSGKPPNERWIVFIFDDMMKAGTLNDENHFSPEVMHCPADDPSIVDGGNADPYGSYHSYNYIMSMFPEPSGGQSRLDHWLRYGQRVPNLANADVCLMVEKQQNVHDWHMDIRRGDRTGTMQQWYGVLYGQTVTATFDPENPGANNKPKYKHGRYGNNFLFLDWSVRSTDLKMYNPVNQWTPHDYYWELFPGTHVP